MYVPASVNVYVKSVLVLISIPSICHWYEVAFVEVFANVTCVFGHRLVGVVNEAITLVVFSFTSQYPHLLDFR